MDIVVGTPGRILDFLEKGTLDLAQLKHVVLDEVDCMLDMGFADAVDSILEKSYEKGKSLIVISSALHIFELNRHYWSMVFTLQMTCSAGQLKNRQLA